MKAMILAGGLSTRLYPLTKNVPKPLVPVIGEPNAAHVIRYLKSYGFDDIAINVHYLPEMIREALGDGSRFGVRLEYLHERVLLGSAGAVEQMRKMLSDAPFAVVGCDDLTAVPLDALMQFREEKDATAAIALVRRDRVDQYGVVVLEQTSRIIGFQEKPAAGTERSNLVNTGIYAFSPAIFDSIAPGEFVDFGKDVFPSLVANGQPFYGFDAGDAYWCDIGTPDEYRRATADVLQGRFHIPGQGTIRDAIWIAPDARIDAGAFVVGPSVISSGVVIERGARVEGSILWRGARVGAGALIRQSVVGMNYAVEPNARIERALVALEAAR